jgi:pyruvate dehydrogenase E1 component alpha subunit
MPREQIDLSCHIEYVSILDEDGNLDQELDPGIEDERLLEWHRTMLRARRFDERQLRLQRQGRVGTFAPVKGQEASQVGVVSAMRDDDWLVPSFRESAAAIARGASLPGLLLYTAGYNEGGRVPEDGRDLPIAVPVASQLPHAVGLAYGAKYRDSDEVVVTFFGDGATSEGDFHESLNFAKVFNVPAIFVCQNNQWAISIPRAEQTKSKTLAQKAVGYGMPGVQVDGNDVIAVHAVASEAIRRARQGDGPSMIECVTYRLEVHTTADDPRRYRDEEEVDAWERRGPLRRLQLHLKGRDLLADDELEELEQEIEQELDDAWEKTREQMKAMDDPLEMFEHLFESMPDQLASQREELAREGGRGEEGA